MKNFLNFCVATLILTMASNLQARRCDMENYWGFGMRGATASTTGHYNAIDVFKALGSPAPSTVTEEHTHIGGISFQGGGFVEYARRNDRWSFGLLADVNGDTFGKNVNFSKVGAGTNNLEAFLQTPFHGGVDARVGGFIIDDGLWYILLGFEGVHNKFALTNASPLSYRGIPSFTTLDYDFNHIGLRVGTGIELRFGDHGVIKFEYRFVQNGSFCTTLIDNITGIDWMHKICTNQQSFGVMLEYLY